MERTHLRARLRVHRLRLKVHAGQLLVAPIGGLPDDLRALIAEHRDVLMLDVQMNSDPDYACCHCAEPLPPGRMYTCAECQEKGAAR